VDKTQLKLILESLLFVLGEPTKIKKLAKILKVDFKKVKEELRELADDLKNNQRGVRILEKDEQVQMVSAPEANDWVEKIFKNDLQEDLSRTALETLAIIAYRGPITRAQIEFIRGVNSSFIIRNLLIRGLIERATNPQDARSYVYKISFDFLKKMGLEKVEDLPEYEKFSKDERVMEEINLDLSADKQKNVKLKSYE